MDNEYNRSQEQKTYVLTNSLQTNLFSGEVAYRTRHDELNEILSEYGGFELGRSYLITALGHHPSIDILREVFLGSRLEDVAHLAYYGTGLIVNNERCQYLLASELFHSGFSSEDFISFLEEHPDKKLVLLNQLDEMMVPGYNEEDLRFTLRKLRTWCNQNGRTLVVYAPMGEDANQLATTYPVAWPELIMGGGYYKWSRLLDTEFDTVILACPALQAVEFYRGKHRSRLKSEFKGVLVKRNFVTDILEAGEWQST